MLNKIMVIGYLGKDPETRQFDNGGAVTNFSVATTEKWKSKDGEPQEHTEWHRIQFGGKLAEIAAQYLRKGSLVYVEGKLRTRQYTDKDGAEKTAVEIRGDSLKMLGGKDADRQEPRKQKQVVSDDDGDIPF
jgi:single-strand DNA-binding protein